MRAQFSIRRLFSFGLLPPTSAHRPFSSAITSLRSSLPSPNPLPPLFTPADVIAALRAQTSPSSAFSLFHWAASQRHYRHTCAVYRAMLKISLSRRRHDLADALIDDILSGACPDPDLPLFNSIVRFFCSRGHLLSAFDTLNAMRRLGGRCAPTVDTFASVLDAIVSRFDLSTNTRFVYLHSVRRLVREMNSSGVTPNSAVMNSVIKAYSSCRAMDEAVKVFDEMPACNCEPDGLAYGYLVEGLCSKGQVLDGMRYYYEMRAKGFVPVAKVYMAVVNSLAVGRRYEEGIAVLLDMLANWKTPDLLTYRTVLEGLCRDGRKEEAFELLEVLKGKKKAMNQKAYSYLLEGMQWLCQDPTRI